MGNKDDQMTIAATDAAEGLQERLVVPGDVTIKKMFGGYSVFESGTMFALVDSQGGIFFKADDTNRDRFEKAGSKKHSRMPYYQVPNSVLENDRDLQEWAQTSVLVSKKAK
jgi:DNA transformation protein